MRLLFGIAAVIAVSSMAFAQSQRPDRAALKSAYQELAANFCIADVDATIEMRSVSMDLISLSNEFETRARAALAAGSEANWRYLNLKSIEMRTLASRVETAISQHNIPITNFTALCRVLSAP
ncbi:MAG: hypothetical protein ACK5XB_10430 [Rhodospirillales bacterium]|jgi:hypothetical protein